MSLVTRLEEEVKDAMRAHDNERRDALRLILSSLKSAEKDLLRPLSEDEELQVRGPNVFPGYWRNESATAAVFTDDGWLRTGDVAECDDEGFYRIKGRLKDMFISGGENVYPAEVEAVLHEHPQVADAAVVGVADERWGEVGVAFVVCDGVGEEELLEWCRARLARFKVPKSFRFVGEIPRNGMGKVQKQDLRKTGVAS